MTTLTKETEFKFALRDDSAFAALVAHLGLPGDVLDDVVLQTNHFFDTAQSSLRKNSLAIRLREQSGAFYLTIKGGKSFHDKAGVLTSRIEEERLLDTETAHAMLDGTASVHTVIARCFRDHSGRLVDTVRELTGDHALIYAGKFENRRITLPPVNLQAGGTTLPVEFELDSIAFPGQALQYEIEVEVPSTDEAGLVYDALVDLLAAAGIEWNVAESKARRFFAIIDGTAGINS
jgi:uncharacterized protein YjbK